MFNQINQLHNMVLSSSITVGLGESRDPEVADVCLCARAVPATSGKEKAVWLRSLTGLSLVAGTCLLFFEHGSKTAHSSKSSEHAGVGLQIPCHPCLGTCYLTGITEKLERCASVILKLTSGLKENICLECGLNEAWCYLWDQMPECF